MRQSSELRPYQNRIVTHLYENDAALVVLRPGGGKTVVALTAIEELIRDRVIRHALVFAPKRVATSVWPDEIEEWSHVTRLRYAVLDQAPEARQALMSEHNLRIRDVTILGIDHVQWLMEHIEHYPGDSVVWDLLAIDEISRMRNPKSKRGAAIARQAHRFKMIWGLTGTLRPNSAQDLFLPARIVTRGKLWGKSFYKWQKERFYPTDYNGYNWAPLPGAEDAINAEIEPYVASVGEGELKQPEPTILFDRITLPDEARRDYDKMERKLMYGAGEDAIVAASAGVATGKLAQIANGFIYDAKGSGRLVHTEKYAWLEDLIQTAAGPTLLIYEFLEDLAMMRALLGADLPYLGDGVSDKMSAWNIESWNRGKLPFMALHPASGGHGLNLQHGGADMAWLSPTWSPEYWEQTIARLARPGQTRQVFVRVCVASDTVDEMKLLRVSGKMTAQEAFEAYLRRRQKRD